MGGLWADLGQLLAKIWAFVRAEPEVAAVVVTVLLPVLGAMFIALKIAGGRIGGWVQRWRMKPGLVARSLPLDVSPFEKFPPRSDGVVRRLMGSQDADDPLAEHNIPYQTRVNGRDIPQEIIDCLERPEDVERRWVLVLGRSGLGKSREAAQAASRLNADGWTVLKLKTSGWETLFRPDTKLFEEMGDRKLLFFLDDVNRMIPMGRRQVGAKPSEGENVLAETHPLDRLLEFLAQIERHCRPENVQVIATARNESIPNKVGEPSELQKLGLDKLELWQRFQQFEIPDPEVEALVNLQRDGVKEAELKADASQFEFLATNSDHTMGVFVINLRKARRENRSLELISEREIKQYWENFYKQARAKYSATYDIYSAVILLQSLGIILTPRAVLTTAQAITKRDRNLLKNFWKIWRQYEALFYLTSDNHTSILNPKDLQLEASQISINPRKDISNVFQLALKAYTYKQTQSWDLFVFLLGLGRAAYNMGLYSTALKISKKLLSSPHPIFPEIGQDEIEFKRSILFELLSLKGGCYFLLDHRKEAIKSFYHALEIKPHNFEMCYNLGVVMDECGAYEKAINFYDRALAVNPNFIAAWNNRGVSSAKDGDYLKAIESFNYVLSIDPNDLAALRNRGLAFKSIGNFQAAIRDFNQILETYSLDFENKSHEIVSVAILNVTNGSNASSDEYSLNERDLCFCIFWKAASHALLFEADQAVKNLRLLLNIQPDFRDIIVASKDFDAIRKDEGFRQLMEGNTN